MKVTLYQNSKHLSEDELLPPYRECLFCNSEDRIAAVPLQETPSIVLMECLNCHAVTASRIPRPEVLADFYANYHDKNEFTGARVRQMAFMMAKIARHIFRKAEPYLPGDCVKILDFGGGAGSVSTAIAKACLASGRGAVELDIVDYNDESVKTSIPNVALKHFYRLEDLPTGQYDLIVASAILEHVPTPRPALTKLLNSTKPGCILYFRTPYVLPLMRVAHTFGRNLDFTYPGHLHDLGSAFWKDIFRILPTEREIRVLESRPSLVETTFKVHFARALAAYVLKAPHYLLGERYTFVGGWEILARAD